MVTETVSRRDARWSDLKTTFSEFHNARNLDGTWNLIRSARMPPDVHPDLARYAQGLRYMSGKLEDDVRILKILHTANPTRFNAIARGSTQAARDLERDHKLCFASWWDNDLNVGRWLDSYNYEGQITHGGTANRLRWKPSEQEEGVSGCPVTVEKVLLDAMVWQGAYRNPDVAICRYSLSVLDCDVKNAKGQRPYYTGDVLGWTSEMLPQDYTHNQGKKVEVIVEDAVDPIALCPLPGCDHRKRRITTSICKQGGKEADYEEVDCSDSPFRMCSFVVVGGDVRHTERDPHRILRPSAWILYDLVLQYNFLFNSLIATYARELADDRMYVNASATNIDVFQALSSEDDGQELKKPEEGGDSIARMPGPVGSFPKPSTQELMALLDKVEREYEKRRPNPALTGQMALSEVTGTGAVLQTQGAGLMLAEDLFNYDTDGPKRFHDEIVHGIRYTHYMTDKDVRYVATVSGRENVMGSRGSASPGDEVFLDARKCEKPVSFYAETSKDTPADRRDREERARTAASAGIFVQRQVFEAYDIFDPEQQEEELFRESVRKFLEPMEQRRIAARLVARSAAVTGVDSGEEAQIQNLPLPDPKTGQVQTYNTLPANASRLNPPPVEVAPTGNNGAGGSSGLA